MSPRLRIANAKQVCDASAMDPWKALVEAFEMAYLPGMDPWEPVKLVEEAFPGASHGEKCTIRFLVNLWNAADEWSCGTFDLFDAYGIWDETRRKAFLSWANDPFWP